LEGQYISFMVEPMLYESLETEFVQAKAGKIHVLKNGIAEKEKNLIFLHGMGANTMTWERLIPYIGDSYGIVLIDMLGHGLSDAPKLDYTPKLQAETVSEIKTSLGIGKYSLVGNSYGGWIAAYGCSKGIFTTMDGLENLVLEDSAGLKKEVEDEIKKTGYDKFVEYMVKKSLEINGNKEYVMRSIMKSENSEYLLDADLLGKIKTKTTIVWGSNDKIIPIGYADMFLNGIKGSRLITIENGGHVPHYFRPMDFAKALAESID